MIDVNEISYSYPLQQDAEGAENAQQKASVKALDQVSLQAEQGEYICILGGNGSGKSTLARHLNALLAPDEGTVWISGLNSREPEHVWDIRTKVGMIFQNPDNQMVASVVDEEVAFGLENLGVPTEQIRERVAKALEETGMKGYEKEQPYYLSGGQKQRVAIAGILAMDPSCIVMDESTSMLDPLGRQEIMEKVLELNRERGLTLINITHYMEEAICADRVFVMDQGKVLLTGTPEEVFAHREQIEQAKIRLPLVCRLAERLRELGVALPKSVITADRLIEELHSLRICIKIT